MCLVYAEWLHEYIISLQGKEIGEPQKKKGKCLVGGDDEEEEPNEVPEDVISPHWHNNTFNL